MHYVAWGALPMLGYIENAHKAVAMCVVPVHCIACSAKVFFADVGGRRQSWFVTNRCTLAPKGTTQVMEDQLFHGHIPKHPYPVPRRRTTHGGEAPAYHRLRMG